MVGVIAGAEAHVDLHDMERTLSAAGGHLLLIFDLPRFVDIRHLRYDLVLPAAQTTGILGPRLPHLSDHHFPADHVNVQKRRLVAIAIAQNHHPADVDEIGRSLQLGKTESFHHLLATEQTKIVGGVHLGHRDPQGVVAQVLRTRPCL